MTEIFPTNIDRNFLNHTGMVRPFCGFPMLASYQNHRLLSSTHVLITHSCIHDVMQKDFVWLLLLCYVADTALYTTH